MWDISGAVKKGMGNDIILQYLFVTYNNFIFKCLFVSVTKVSVHFLICFYLLKVSKTEIFANIFADVISDGSWWRQQQHLVHSVHYCPIMRHTPCLADLQPMQTLFMPSYPHSEGATKNSFRYLRIAESF